MVTTDEENRLTYLLSGSCDFLPSSYVKLRSHLNTHSAHIAEQHNLRIFKSRMTCCPYCFISWTCDTSSFQLLPSKKLKIRNKSESEKKNSASDQKTAQEESRNVLILKCKVCTRKSSFSLVKKKGVKEKVQREENVASVKKKRKKKDRSCGLHVNLEKTVAPQPFTIKKKSGLAAGENTGVEILAEIKPKNHQQLKSPVILPKSKSKSDPGTQQSKNLIINPFAPQALSKHSRKKDHQKLKHLKKAVKKGSDVTKKTLKDFLTLI